MVRAGTCDVGWAAGWADRGRSAGDDVGGDAAGATMAACVGRARSTMASVEDSVVAMAGEVTVARLVVIRREADRGTLGITAAPVVLPG